MTISARDSLLSLGAALLVAATAGAQAPGARDTRSLVDTAAEDMVFHFRTKFNREYDPRESQKVIVAYKTPAPPVLDGMLEDECWKHAGRTNSAFIQMMTTDVSPKQTVLYACYDDKNLYLGYVAEEPNTKSVGFIERRRSPDSRGAEAYAGDCAEIFIETDGLGGDGHVWQFLFNIYSDMTYNATIPGEDYNWDSGYRVKGALGPKCWVVEVAIPFTAFRRGDYAYDGPPKRGEKWGLRAIRDGFPPPSGEDRMFSTWTFNPVDSWYNPWPTGMLVFDDPNCLRNGEFNELDDKGALKNWNVAKSRPDLEAALRFDPKEKMGAVTCRLGGPQDIVQVSQRVDVKPNKFYRLTGKLKIAEGQGRVTVGVQRPERKREITEAGKWVDVDLDIYADNTQRDMTAFVMVEGEITKVLLDHLKIEQEPFGIEKGTFCLTGNAFREEWNVRDKWKIQGRYTYREPETGVFKPPYRKQWTPLTANGYDDVWTQETKDEWFPFEKGSLTCGGHNLVAWPYPPNQWLGSPTYPNGHEVIYDLGRDFYLVGIDMLVALQLKQVQVYVKPEKADDFILVDKLNGAGVLDPPGPKLYYRARGLNSVARYVKIHLMEGSNEGTGIFFTQLWGQEKGSHGDLEVTRFRWKKGTVVQKPPVPPIRRLREPFILPQPQEVEWTKKDFEVTPATKIAHSAEGLMPGVARDLAEHIRETYGLALPLADLAGELRANPDLRGCIAVGDVANSPAMREVVEREKLAVTPAMPGDQGYVMIVEPSRVIIAGSGDDHVGAYYGITSLLQILHVDAQNRLLAPGCRIRDWPNTLLRGTMFCMFDPLRLQGDFKRILKAFSMIRINGVTQSFACDPYDEGQRKTMESLADYARRTGFVQVGNLAGGGRGSGWPIGTEINDDENDKYLIEKEQLRRLNVCPSSNFGFQCLTQPIDRSMYDSLNDAETSDLSTDEMDHTSSGSRWNADRRTRVRNLTGDRLFWEYICRYYDTLRRHGVKMETIDCMLTKDAGNDLFHHMGLCYPYLPHDILISSWKGSVGKPDTDPEYAIDNFERCYTFNTWGFNGNYGDTTVNFKQLTNRRIWGTVDCWWGGYSNEGMTVGLLAKIAGGGSMCGNLLLQVESQYLWHPRQPMPNTMEFVERIFNNVVRLNEIVNNRPFPSWQDNRQKKWFKADLRPIANWSHIDEVPADGKGWLDWGSNYDMRLLPMGEVQFEEVPFTILDPAKNNDRSIIFIANYPSDARLAPALPPSVPDIPIGRKVASLCFLKARVGMGEPPSFVALYEGGRQLTFNVDVRNLEAAESYQWSRPHDYENMANYGLAIGDANPLLRHLDFLSRPAWLGYTTSGDECSLRIHEWVNPYPELALEKIRIFFPPAQLTGEREAIFAVSGLEAEPQDVARWTDGRKRPPLRSVPAPVSLAGLKPLIAGGKVAQADTKGKRTINIATLPEYQDAKGEWLFRASGAAEAGRVFQDGCLPCRFAEIAGGAPVVRRLEITLRNPSQVNAVLVRGRFIQYKEEGNAAAGEFVIPHLDVKVSVHTLDGRWVEAGELKAICGEDGDYVLPAPGLIVDRVRFDVDPMPYHENYYGSLNVPGLCYVQLYGPETGK